MHKVHRLTDSSEAVKIVCGWKPDEKTVRKWIMSGLNGVRLKAKNAKPGHCKHQSRPEWVIEFIYETNERVPPAEVFELNTRHLPFPLTAVARHVMGYDPDRSTLLRWRTNGLNGAKLDVLKVGNARLISVHDFQMFLDNAGFE